MPVAYENIKVMVQKAAALASTMLEQWPAAKSPEVSLTDEVERARIEWHLARRYFETVTDPDLIDCIYNLGPLNEYSYLLKQDLQETSEVI